MISILNANNYSYLEYLWLEFKIELLITSISIGLLLVFFIIWYIIDKRKK